ncbi:hypothetical protein J6590_005046 [Homalodisca vitripennis]|nr:hypothetical protein J6590_005046 [Homalodisca vitripennis]
MFVEAPRRAERRVGDEEKETSDCDLVWGYNSTRISHVQRVLDGTWECVSHRRALLDIPDTHQFMVNGPHYYQNMTNDGKVSILREGNRSARIELSKSYLHYVMLRPTPHLNPICPERGNKPVINHD